MALNMVIYSMGFASGMRDGRKENFMENITCPHCGKSIAGNHRYEVKCYHCGTYNYLTDNISVEDEKKELYDAARQYAYAYVPENVREYVEKYGLAQSGPTTLRWFRDHEEEAFQKMKQFLDDKLNEETLRALHAEHKGDLPFVLFTLDHLNFPLRRAALEWDLDPSGSCDF
jgi:phage FluMu protein Com